MPDPQSLEASIRENATGPKRAKGDSGEIEQHDLKSQLEADRYLASKQAMNSKKLGIKFTKLIPPGSA